MQSSDILQSQKAYIAQFDPTSPDYHGGTLTPVPLGGARVPSSMPQQHPQNFNIASLQPTPEEFGPEYQRVELSRTEFTNLKKALDKLSPFVEAIFRHTETYNAKGDKTNEKHVELHKKDIEKEQKEIQVIEEGVMAILGKLGEGEGIAEIRKETEAILKQATVRFETKEDLTEFGFRTKRLTAKLFADTKKQLQVLKKIKKEFKAQQKVETPAEKPVETVETQKVETTTETVQEK